MGQKVNPHGLRVGVIKDWDSRWFAKKAVFGDLLVEDYNLRKQLKEQLYAAGVPKIEIERDASKVRVHIHCAKPGMVIGKGGAEIEKLRLQCESILKKPVTINIVEIRNPDLNATLVAENVAVQLEKRISFRRAMKQAIGRAMKPMGRPGMPRDVGAKGIKIQVSGRLGGAEIARSEHYHEGTIPLQTLRADIDYGFAEAKTTYGRIGIKVWIYRGEVLQDNKNQAQQPRQQQSRAPRNDRDRPPRQQYPRGDRPQQQRGPQQQRAPQQRPAAPQQRPAAPQQRPAAPQTEGGGK